MVVPSTTSGTHEALSARGDASWLSLRFWRSTLRAVFWATVVGDLLLLAVMVLVIRINPQWLLEQRLALFSDSIADALVFTRSPEALRRDGFRSDPAALRAERGGVLRAELAYLADVPPDFGARATLERAQWLAARMGRDGGEAFPAGTALVEKLKQMPAGIGLCSDHVEGFIALCSVFGIEAREVSSSVHTMAGVYARELGRWIWIDPEFALVARAPSGELMTMWELRDAALRGMEFQLEYFGGDPKRVMAGIDPRTHEYYDAPGDFRDLVLTFGNNVFEFDGYRRGTAWMPRVLRQAVLLGLGLQPGYRVVDDERSPLASRLPGLRGQSLAIAMPLALGTLAYPLLLVGARLRRRS